MAVTSMSLGGVPKFLDEAGGQRMGREAFGGLWDLRRTSPVGTNLSDLVSMVTDATHPESLRSAAKARRRLSTPNGTACLRVASLGGPTAVELVTGGTPYASLTDLSAALQRSV